MDPVATSGTNQRATTASPPHFSLKFTHILAIALIAFSLIAGCQSPSVQPLLGPAGKLEIHIINVGQGDAVLIRCPEGTHELLIDSGDTRYPGSTAKFKAYMEARQARTDKIEVVVATHPHADHIGNLEWVVDNYPIGLYVDSCMKSTTTTYKDLMKAVANDQVAHKTAQDAQLPDIDFCPLAEVNARILRPKGYADEEDNPNNVSVVVRVDYKTTSILFVGDAETEEEHLLESDPDTRKLLNCDFLKAGHHGSNTSSSPEFLDVVTPRIIAISCGEKEVGTNKKYRHPRYTTVMSLLSHADPRESPAVTIDAYDSHGGWKKVKLNAAVYVTQKEGDLVFESDGTTIHRK